MGMTPRAIKYAMFIISDGTWQYLHMPFGLKNVPASFQRMMNGIFRDLIRYNVLIYLDDTTIYISTFEEHIEVLEEVLRRLCKNGLFLKPSKYHLTCHELKFLGFKVDKNGIYTNTDKIESIMNYLTPINKSEIHAFLGLARYYHYFVKDFSIIAEPLNRLLEKPTLQMDRRIGNRIQDLSYKTL